ncbi:MAG TPA: capsule assembly Wzi family protein, partial [Acidobacteriaceae bacterium]|nr:capsule assembly Wzi family protein [Acidobacteriaceae bacterium]
MKQNYFRPLLAALLLAAVVSPAALLAQSDSQMPAPANPPAASGQQQESMPAYGKQPKPAPEASPAPPNPSPNAAPQQSPPAPVPASEPQQSAVVPSTVYQAMPQYLPIDINQIPDSAGSTYIPVDSWMYPALMRLYSMGYLNTAVIGMRPWTRLSVLRMLYAMQERVHMDNNPAALEIYNAVLAEVSPDLQTAGGWTPHGEVDSLYERVTGIGGTPLNDSFHLGQTIINNYGRPYEQGFNNYLGFSARGGAGRFTLYVRGEYQHAPSATGYTP